MNQVRLKSQNKSWYGLYGLGTSVKSARYNLSCSFSSPFFTPFIYTSNLSGQVRCSTRDGSAKSGSDYEPRSKILRFQPGTKEVTFQVFVPAAYLQGGRKKHSLTGVVAFILRSILCQTMTFSEMLCA